VFNKLKPKGEFGRNVLTLMTGTILAQAIPIAMAPILTRIYTPNDFGLFAVYSSVLSVLAVISTGRYELAIMNPHDDEDAKYIVVLSLLIAAMLGLILAVLVFFFNGQITVLLNSPQINEWLYFIPLTVFLTGCYQSFSYWLNRKKQYKHLSQNKILQTGSMVGTQFAEGMLGAGATGLLSGMIAGLFISVLAIAHTFGFERKLFGSAKIKNIAYQYRQYPIVQAPTSLLNTISAQAPVFFLAKAYTYSMLGFYNLTVKVLSAPAAIISKSIGQVYFQRVSEYAKTAPEMLVSEILQTAKKLAFISLVIFGPLLFFGKELFNLVFGANWADAGVYAQILTPAIAIKFIVSPVSTIFLATNKIGLGSLWQTLYFTTTIVTLYFASKYNIKTFLWIYTIHELCLYMLYFYLMLLTSKSFYKLSSH
jgi:O-antigen/teichoic acid export membrane protein